MKKISAILIALMLSGCAGFTMMDIQGGLQDAVGLCNYVEKTTISQMDAKVMAKSKGTTHVEMEYCSDDVLNQEAYIIYSVKEYDNDKLIERRDILVKFEKKNKVWQAVSEKKFFGRVHIADGSEEKELKSPIVKPVKKDAYGY